LSSTRIELPLHWRRRLVAFRSSGSGLVVMALVVGAGAAGLAVVFRELIKVFTLVLSGHPDYAAVPGASHPGLEGLGRWFVLGAPVVAGLLYGPLVHLFAREARGHGVPEVMFAVARRGGRIRPQVAAVKALASALCIGGGGSVGREGPIVQIGSALGSTVGGVVRVAEPRRRVLVACGAAAGIAATFNAPLAGVFFAMELILSDFTAEAFGVVVLSSVTASVLGRAALGNAPFLDLPAFRVEHWQEYLSFAVLGLLAGLVGVIFTRVLYAIEDGCDAIWRGPEWLRPAVGGLLLGVVLLVLPEMYGVGYPVLGKAIAGHYAVAFLLALLVGKMVATSLTIGIGGSGGVFAPSLFIGAMLGAGYGEIAAHVAPGITGPAGAYGLIGMGAVFAGAARAPITAVIIMFELTGEYSIILPLMAAIVLASSLSQWLTPDTIYTLKLRRRGIDLARPEVPTAPGATLVVRDVMGPVPVSVPQSMALGELAGRLAASARGVLPVTRDDGTYAGVVTARVVADALADGRHDAAAASLVLELPVTLHEDEPLDAALRALDQSGCAAVPVIDREDAAVVGWVAYPDCLRALHPASERRAAAVAEHAPSS
jgi:CIC family chloride channel protein